MSTYEAPAKLNLSLHVGPPVAGGYHPLVSLVQTIEWCDLLTVHRGEGDDSLEVSGDGVGVDDNLVLRALAEARTEADVPPLSLLLEKRLPVAAGLGGGSSDAAAALAAARDISGLDAGQVEQVAARIGADVTLFLTGGTLEMSGAGERIERLRPLEGVAFAVVVPYFGLSTAAVYGRWDEMEGPEGEAVPDEYLPPSLRDGMPMRNDLVPAAIDLEPRLGDFMADVRGIWGSPVSMTGSGSACFGYFPDLGEAAHAAREASHLCSVATGVGLRRHGVSRVGGRPRD